MAALRSPGEVPKQRCISPTPFSTIRLTVPRQPAWNTPTARRLSVHQNYRQAIGGQNCQQDTRRLSDQAVAGKCRFLGDFGVETQ